MSCYCPGEYRNYMTHRRRGETPCAKAKAAWAAYYRKRRNSATYQPVRTDDLPEVSS